MAGRLSVMSFATSSSRTVRRRCRRVAPSFRRHGSNAQPPRTSRRGRGGLCRPHERVAGSLTGERATFSERELRAVVLEQGVGELAPERVGEYARELVASGEVVVLKGRRM